MKISQYLNEIPFSLLIFSFLSLEIFFPLFFLQKLHSSSKWLSIFKNIKTYDLLNLTIYGRSKGKKLLSFNLNGAAMLILLLGCWWDRRNGAATCLGGAAAPPWLSGGKMHGVGMPLILAYLADLWQMSIGPLFLIILNLNFFYDFLYFNPHLLVFWSPWIKFYDFHIWLVNVLFYFIFMLSY